MIARIALVLALALAGCTSRSNGRDGMDGAGVAAGLRYELQNDE